MKSVDKRLTEQEIQHFREQLEKFGNDTVCKCFKCGRIQYLNFADGLKNGWSKCCGGLTMTMVYMDTDIDKAVSAIFQQSVKEAWLKVQSNE